MAELKLPLDFLSSTQIDMYLRCPMQYYYRYRLHKKIPPPWSMYVGRCGHTALDFNFSQKIKTYADLDFNTIGDIYNDEFKNNPAKDGVNWQGENEGLVKDKGYGSLKNFFQTEKASEKIQPLAVQKKIDIEFKNKSYGLRAYLDIVTIDKEVGDFKFSLKTPSADQLTNDTQMTIYGLSHLYEYGKVPQSLWLDYLISLNSGPKYIRFPIIRSEQHYSSMLEDIGNIAEDIAMRCKTDIWFRNKKGWWCLSMDTEILTNNGWKEYHFLDHNDLIFTLDKDGFGEWQPYEIKFTKKSLELIEYSSKSINFCVTPDHKLYVKTDGSHGPHLWHFINANKIMENKRTQYNVRVSAITERPDYNLSYEMIELCAWILAEGHYRTDRNLIEISQSIHSDKNNIIIELLSYLNIKYSKKIDKINPDRTQMITYRISAEDSKKIRKIQPSKNIPDWVFKLSHWQFNIWLYHLCLGDGHIRKNNFRISQKSEMFIDKLQSLAVTNGYSAIKSKERISSTGGKFHTLSMTKGRVNIKIGNSLNKPKAIKGNRVWCVSVPNKIIMTRRNGRTIFVGNCSPKSCGYYLLCRPEDQARSDEVLAKLQKKENVILKKGN